MGLERQRQQQQKLFNRCKKKLTSFHAFWQLPGSNPRPATSIARRFDKCAGETRRTSWLSAWRVFLVYEHEQNKRTFDLPFFLPAIVVPIVVSFSLKMTRRQPRHLLGLCYVKGRRLSCDATCTAMQVSSDATTMTRKKNRKETKRRDKQKRDKQKRDKQERSRMLVD